MSSTRQIGHSAEPSVSLSYIARMTKSAVPRNQCTAEPILGNVNGRTGRPVIANCGELPPACDVSQAMKATVNEPHVTSCLDMIHTEGQFVAVVGSTTATQLGPRGSGAS